MSFIIKALKKLEEENAGRTNAPVSLDSAILAPDRRSSSPRSRRAVWAVIPLVFVAGAGISWFFLHKTVPPSRSREAENAKAPVVVPAPAPPVAAVSAQPVALPSPAAPSAAAPLPQAPVAAKAPVRRDQANLPRQASRQPRTGEIPPPADVQATNVSQVPSVSSGPSGPLVVNGIAYQDDPAASSAVVNGTFVKQGMSVGGSRVERIFPNKVRFSGNGGVFDVHFSK